MKVAILAGGFGTRISEESHLKPKPMIEIGGKPMLWHILKHYSSYGFNEFIICAGYKQHSIKEYFANYYLYQSDVTFDFVNANEMKVHHNHSEPWKVTIVDTGLNTMTGGRVKRIRKYVNNEPFMLTYGDGLSDINITELVKFHKSHGKTVTMSAFNMGQRFGILDIGADGLIKAFREKAKDDGGLINIGFMVINPDFFDSIEGDSTVLEKSPMEAMAKSGQLMSYKHDGFWQCMDTLREKEMLEKLWQSGCAPWKRWDD
ncbi:MAG: glucose-1-phosphate cytidylyltransferase [Defluviitaleaceae bacterium]|nr:glucose-1-phosphate cytidylyltransferase [Defluviitaleaceae bacterium]